MRRAIWFAAGAGLGVYAMVRGRRAAEALTADGLHDRWAALGLGARLFREEVATGKVEAEARLRERFGPTRDRTSTLAGGPDTPSLVPGSGSTDAHGPDAGRNSGNDPSNDPSNDSEEGLQ